mgnify:CR=1 FL=1
MNIIHAFFKPIEKIEGINKADYESLSYCIAALEAISRMIDLSYYIVDYKKREFFYVSGHPLFLDGYEREQVRQPYDPKDIHEFLTATTVSPARTLSPLFTSRVYPKGMLTSTLEPKRIMPILSPRDT